MRIRQPSYYGPVLALLLLTFTTGSFAGPKIVVSIPPLHSLVSSLMAGIDDPVLLLDSDQVSTESLTATQKLHLISADMIIWVGAGLEKQIAATVHNEIPAIDRNMYAISNHLPLLPNSFGEPDQLLMPQDRQKYSDLSFWADPKLAAMAVHHITPKLVRLDPDHADTYLENEVKLLARIKKMGQQLAETLAPYRGMLTANGTVPTYLAWRYELHGDRWQALASNDAAQAATTGCQYFVKAGIEQPRRDGSDIYGRNLVPGTELYFRMMQSQARSITSCIPGDKSVAAGTTRTKRST